jgi:hypothetical protein
MTECLKSHFRWQHYAMVLGLVVLTSFAVQGQNRPNTVMHPTPGGNGSFTVFRGMGFVPDPYQIAQLPPASSFMRPGFSGFGSLSSNGSSVSGGSKCAGNNNGNNNGMNGNNNGQNGNNNGLLGNVGGFGGSIGGSIGGSFGGNFNGQNGGNSFGPGQSTFGQINFGVQIMPGVFVLPQISSGYLGMFGAAGIVGGSGFGSGLIQGFGGGAGGFNFGGANIGLGGGNIGLGGGNFGLGGGNIGLGGGKLGLNGFAGV